MPQSNSPYKLISGDPLVRIWQKELGNKNWPEFMQHDPIVVKYWEHLYDAFQLFQLGLHEEDIAVAIANSIPLRWEGGLQDLPDTGLDWAMEKAVEDHRNGHAFDMLVAVQILVAPPYRGKQISYIMLEYLKDTARKNGIYRIALPVRPTKKHLYPDLSMDEYILKQNDEGELYDPWLRVHVRSGGEIQGVCNKSMTISGNIDEWQAWTGQSFPSSGPYIVPFALAPIKIDKEKDLGIYHEPNVWITYELSN